MGLGRRGGLLRHPVRHCGGMFAPRGQERRRLLPLRALHAVVADRHLDVRRINVHELRQHVHRVHPQLGALRELEVVGVPPHGNADGIRLFAPVGAFRRKERHRVLRAALLRTGGGVPARVPRNLPRHRVQRDNHRAGRSSIPRWAGSGGRSTRTSSSSSSSWWARWSAWSTRSGIPL